MNSIWTTAYSTGPTPIIGSGSGPTQVYFNPHFGIAVGNDARALSVEEQQAYYNENLAQMQNVEPPASYALLAANYRPEEPALNERFADFKIRLADALERRAKRS